MTPFILFSILFTCGLINSYFFPPSKLLQWLLSLLPTTPSSPNPTDKAAKKKEKKKKKEEVNTVDLDFIFSTFDSDGDGFITARELEESLRRLRISATKKEVMRMVESVDSNGDGLIDLDEFRELYDSIERREAGEGRVNSGKDDDDDDDEEEDMGMRDVFDVFDGNRDGVITVGELSLVLKTLGLKQGEKEDDCRDMIRKVDLDGDGMVNFEEFKKMMMVKGVKLF